MGELYRQAKGSENGLGDLVLQAYDRNVALIHTRELGLRASDPNAQLTDPMEFTLTGLDGQKLSMASLKGKVVVFDFWATWCEPCRGQHPLYEQVKQRFQDNSDVVFLSIDTDEDREPVRRFLEEEKWSDTVYFEDGLSRALRGATNHLYSDHHHRREARPGFQPHERLHARALCGPADRAHPRFAAGNTRIMATDEHG